MIVLDPDYPTGWYIVAYSADLAPDRLLQCRYFGLDLLLWRSHSGLPILSLSRCPHLGTDLAVGGEIRGGRLRCRMHGWEFDDTGSCQAVPYADRRPNSGLTTYPVFEQDGAIWLWWHPATTPAWELPRIPETLDDAWSQLKNDGNRWTVKTVPQMIQENAADLYHLEQLHSFACPETKHFAANGQIFEHIFTHLRAYDEVGLQDPIEVLTTIEIFGLGVSKQNSIAGAMVESTTVCTTTPIEQGLVDLRMSSAVRRSFDDTTTDEILAIVLDTTRTTVEEDIPLWETRDYTIRNFHTGDKCIVSFQHWAQQFYPDFAGVPR